LVALGELSNFEQIWHGVRRQDWTMPVGYRFVIHSGDNVEALGVMPLADDEDARLFGVEVVRDLMKNAAPHYAAYTMNIIQDKRMVATIPFGPAA
jgi:hypothetical protein